MEDPTRTGLHDLHLASRKAEEAGLIFHLIQLISCDQESLKSTYVIVFFMFCAAWRRFQAAAWLETLVGPLGTSKQPSEREFLSCLRNGLILCNAINKIQPGAVTKVFQFLCVENSFFIRFSTLKSAFL